MDIGEGLFTSVPIGKGAEVDSLHAFGLFYSVAKYKSDVSLELPASRCDDVPLLGNFKASAQRPVSRHLIYAWSLFAVHPLPG